MSDSPVLLTVRGTYVPSDVDGARALHDQTAGSAPGIAAARALGDLSHKVYVPCAAGGPSSDAKPGEVLFMDTWLTPQGIQQFFSNQQVQAQAGRLFSSRDAAIWMPAEGSFSFHLPAPAGKTGRYVGIVRGKITAPAQAIEAFHAAGTRALPDDRKRGQLSHAIYIKLSPPGDAAPPELLGVDVWASLPGLQEHYGDSTHMAPLGAAFAGRPQTSVWEQPKNPWSEW